MMQVLLFVASAIATWRLTHLLVVDKIRPVAVVRWWFISTFGIVSTDGHVIGGKRLGWIGWSLAYVWTCVWCMSPWAGGLVWLGAWLGHVSMPFPWLMIACGSGLAGVMGMVEAEHEQRFEARDREANQ